MKIFIGGQEVIGADLADGNDPTIEYEYEDDQEYFRINGQDSALAAYLG